jgi:hypothetical protein
VETSNLFAASGVFHDVTFCDDFEPMESGPEFFWAEDWLAQTAIRDRASRGTARRLTIFARMSGSAHV